MMLLSAPPALWSPNGAAEPSDDEVIAESWERGRLAYKVLPYQRPVYDDIKAQLWGIKPDGTGEGSYREPRGKHRRYIPEIHRKFGKSFLVGIIASELARQKEGARIFWGAETQKQVTLFLKPIMDEITADCPEHLRPKWYRQDGMWVWPETEAHVIVGGCEDEAKCNRLRGPTCDLFIIDEAGQIALLHYLYTSVVLWMISRSGGRVLMPSTPATTPAHPFTAFCALAEAGEGGYAHRNVHDSCFSDEQIAELAKECGGTDTPQWKREALALRVVDESRAIIPEFSAGDNKCTHCGKTLDNHGTVLCESGETQYESTSAEYAICRPFCTRCGVHFDKHGEGETCADGGTFAWELEVPEYRDCYVSADPGWFPDLFAVLGAYRDFRRAITVIEDELEFSKPTTEDVAKGNEELGMRGIQQMEEQRWAAHFERMRMEGRPDEARPYKRVSDVALQIICDLNRLHGLEFLPTRKDEKDAQVNETRLIVKHRQIAIHPRCKKLRAHLKAGIKTKNGKDWERIEGFGHFDFIDALVYLIRNIDTQHNPYPAVPYGMTPDTHWFSPKAANTNAVPEQFKDLAAAWPGFKGGR
jgi:hypothetical protein